MAKPTYKPFWANNDVSLPNTGQPNKARPREVLRDTGIDKGQKLTAEELNWMFDNIRDWVNHFEGITDTNQTNISSLQSSVSTNTGNISTNTNDISNNESRITQNEQDIAAIDTDLGNYWNITEWTSNLGSSSTGHQRLPSGLYIQWGVVGPYSGSQTISYPVAFPASLYVVITSTRTTGTTVNSDSAYQTYNEGITTFDAYRQDFTGSTIGQDNGFFWVAIGR